MKKRDSMEILSNGRRISELPNYSDLKGCLDGLRMNVDGNCGSLLTDSLQITHSSHISHQHEKDFYTLEIAAYHKKAFVSEHLSFRGIRTYLMGDNGRNITSTITDSGDLRFSGLGEGVYTFHIE